MLLLARYPQMIQEIEDCIDPKWCDMGKLFDFNYFVLASLLFFNLDLLNRAEIFSFVVITSTSTPASPSAKQSWHQLK